MHNALPTSSAHRNEKSIVNLDDGTRYSLDSLREETQPCILTVSIIFDRSRNWCDISGIVL